MKPQVVTADKAQEVFYSVQSMSVLIELLDIESRVYFHDHKFNEPFLNNHIKRLKDSIGAIQNHLGKKIIARDEEFFKYEHCALLSEVVKFFMFQPKEELEDTLNQIEELKKQLA
jgi:hypothetical protein